MGGILLNGCDRFQTAGFGPELVLGVCAEMACMCMVLLSIGPDVPEKMYWLSCPACEEQNQLFGSSERWWRATLKRVEDISVPDYLMLT